MFDKERFIRNRRKVIYSMFSHLNPEQRMAVCSTQGPLLILAGAGSGKTTVLINRIAGLLKFGTAAESYEIPSSITNEDAAILENYALTGAPQLQERAEKICALDPVSPIHILAITFTNKAAEELKARLGKMLGDDIAKKIWASTFHSACVRILRHHIEKLGVYRHDFAIYDDTDSLSLIEKIIKQLNYSNEKIPAKELLSVISLYKNAGKTPDDMDSSSYYAKKVFQEYNAQLIQNNALDFDDLLSVTVKLLESHEDVRNYYQDLFHYILVDEYQDTNVLQYKLVHLLTGTRQNLCVVGDDDQSIYKFRGATIQNILDFEKDYPGARVIKLEQNYRSTKTILSAANAVIHENKNRRDKTLWTENEPGCSIVNCETYSDIEEAKFVTDQIKKEYDAGIKYEDIAVLYRMNAQSNMIQTYLRNAGIPYRVSGGTDFFERAEIKTSLAYLCVVNNPDDNLRLLRIINTPARNIGPKTVEKITQAANQHNCSIFSVLEDPLGFPEIKFTSKTLLSIRNFVSLIHDAQKMASEPIEDILDILLDRSGFLYFLENEKEEESEKHLNNIAELKQSIRLYEENKEGATLGEYLDDMVLSKDKDDPDNKASVSLMTVHSAKGLEFSTVFIIGVEDGIFPMYNSLDHDDELQEERRLCYVAITRAKTNLFIIRASHRMLYGSIHFNEPSRFLKAIPKSLMKNIRRNSLY